jgi:hypothetical protein
MIHDHGLTSALLNNGQTGSPQSILEQRGKTATVSEFSKDVAQKGNASPDAPVSSLLY